MYYSLFIYLTFFPSLSYSFGVFQHSSVSITYFYKSIDMLRISDIKIFKCKYTATYEVINLNNKNYIKICKRKYKKDTVNSN